jgi:hypothetical protein
MNSRCYIKMFQFVHTPRLAMKNRDCRPRKQLPINPKKWKKKQRKIHISPSEEEEEEEEEDPLEVPPF